MSSKNPIRFRSFFAVRRNFAAPPTLLAGIASLLLLSVVDPADAAKPVATPVKAHPLMRVRIELEVKGNVNVSKNPLEKGKRQTEYPIDSKAILDFEERPIRPINSDPSSEVIAAERYYHEATSSGVLNKTSSERSLRDAVRHALVRRDQLPETIYSDDSYFTHDELSLLRSPISSVAVDRLLPSEAVSVDDRYEIDINTLCSVLNLSSVDDGKVSVEVKDVDEKLIRFQLEGKIEGSVDGVSTELRLVGKLTYDRIDRCCSWLVLAIHETREVSRAEPGFEVAATIRMIRKPMKQPVALAKQPAKIDFESSVPQQQLFVELRSDQLDVGVMLDRHWRMIRDVPGMTILRMVQHDQNIAQCNLRSLVALPEGHQWTLDAFKADIGKLLGKQLVQLVEGEETVSAQGLRVLKVVADGQTEGVPIRWIMLHFSDDHGRRIHATFTLAADQIEQFAGTDTQLADSLRFLKPPQKEEPESDEKEIAGGSTAPPNIAKRPSNEEVSGPSNVK